MSDLDADWMIVLERKYYLPLYFAFGVMILGAVPVQFWGEKLLNAIFIFYSFLYIRYRMFSKINIISPIKSWFASLTTFGEGWHDFHHSFPWDYNVSELPMPFDLTSILIRFCAKIGLAYDLKTTTPDMVNKRILRKGDGTHFERGNDEARSASDCRQTGTPTSTEFFLQCPVCDSLKGP